MRRQLWVFGIGAVVTASCGPLSSRSSSDSGGTSGQAGADDGGTQSRSGAGGESGSAASGAGEDAGGSPNLGGVDAGGAGAALGGVGSAGEGGDVGEAGAGGVVEPDGPLTIATGQMTPTGIAIAGSDVYWANRDAKTIVRCKKSGCPSSGPTLLASTTGMPLGITVDASSLYWIESVEPGVDQTGRVYECPIAGCDGPPTLLVDWVVGNKTNDVHVASSTLYIAAWPMLGTCSSDGCDAPTSIAGGPFVSVDTDAQFLYGARYGGSHVVRCPLAGCKNDGTDTVTLVVGVSPLAVAIDETYLYFADHDYFSGVAPTRHQISRCPLAGCTEQLPPEVVRAGDDVSPYGLTSSATRLYFTNIAQGTVVSMPKP
jgi:hypothetical protein